MKRKAGPLTLAIWMICAVCATLPSQAQEPSAEVQTSKIAIVSFQRVFKDYARTEDVKRKNRELQEKRRQLENHRRQLEQRLKELMQDRAKNLEQIISTHREIAKAELDFEQAVKEVRDHNLYVSRHISSDIVTMVRRVAEERGYQLVLNYIEPDESSLQSHLDKFYQENIRTFPYTNNRSDITDEVIQRLNAEWNKKSIINR